MPPQWTQNSDHQVLPQQARYVQANSRKQKERERNYTTDTSQ